MIQFQDGKTAYAGAVIETRERNYHDDSDFYALVWDEGESRIEEVQYATTRAYTYDAGASVDLTDENRARMEAWCRERNLETARSIAKATARRVEKGRRVRVVRGRKVEHGTEGEVFWIGPVTQYSPSRWAQKSQKIGIRLSDEPGLDGKGWKDVAWTDIKNVEVVDPEQHEIPEEQLQEAVNRDRNPYATWRGSVHVLVAQAHGCMLVA